MTANSKIEWTDHTFNPWIGCTNVSPGCDNCYAEALDRRWAGGTRPLRWGAGVARTRTSAANWRSPLRWNAQAVREGRRFRVFCASMADVFDNEVPIEWRVDLFRLIERTPALDWLILTKRIGNAAKMMFVARGGHLPLQQNVWLGATIVNQEEADRDIPKLLATPARIRFLSIEPMLGPIDLTRLPLAEGCASECCGQWRLDVLKGVSFCGDVPRDPADETDEAESRIDWVICGGESGRGARPMHPDWPRSLRVQCVREGVPFFFKQWGDWLPWTHFNSAEIADEPEQTRFATREYVSGGWRDIGRPSWVDSLDGNINEEHCVGRVGKQAAGRLLDGRTWDELPI